jgi:hypothetical protein
MKWVELESFMTDGIAPQGRQISITTGSMINHALAVRNTIDYLEWMEENKNIEPDVVKNLKTMLMSEDIDNFNIAILALEQLKK